MRGFADVVPAAAAAAAADRSRRRSRAHRAAAERAAERRAASRGAGISTRRRARSRIDRGQIEQALLNVLKNAIEAIDGEGTITVRLTSTTGPADADHRGHRPRHHRRGAGEPLHAVLQHQAARPGHRPDAGAGDPRQPRLRLRARAHRDANHPLHRGVRTAGRGRAAVTGTGAPELRYRDWTVLD